MELIFLSGFKRLAPAEILVDWSEIDPERARVCACGFRGNSLGGRGFACLPQETPQD